LKLISLIVPLYNESESVGALIEQLEKVKVPGYKIEIILINDGSTDDTESQVAKHGQKNIRLINFSRNYGQTAAMSAGFDAAKGEIIVSLDGDLQNDPADIPKLIQKMDEGYDIVSGWRVKRQDQFIRVLPSKIANRLISWISGVHIHDYGCTLKAYRKDMIHDFKLYGEMHRFIPIYGYWQGAKIAEIPVNHRSRKFGKSKYGMIRIFKVLLDLLTIKFLGSFSTKPIYFFGGIGIGLCSISGLLFTFTLYQKIFLQAWVHRNPLFMVAIFIFLTGIQFLFFGILAEIMVRIYYETGNKKIYRIKT
jgi:glycosyltransferase involved in cell wall biosynthesis